MPLSLAIPPVMLHNGRYMILKNHSVLSWPTAHCKHQPSCPMRPSAMSARSVRWTCWHAASNAVVMNTFHLMQKPGSSTVQSLGGLHKMSAWQRPIITDSGGFQAYSLIRQNASSVRSVKKDSLFNPKVPPVNSCSHPKRVSSCRSVLGRISLSAWMTVRMSIHPTNSSLFPSSRTVKWAKRSRNEFDRLMDEKGINIEDRPRLFAVIQGGGSKDLRKQCADRLLEIGL